MSLWASSLERANQNSVKGSNKVPAHGAEEGRSRSTEINAEQGQKYLATLICKEIASRISLNYWDDLLEGGAATASSTIPFEEINESSSERETGKPPQPQEMARGGWGQQPEAASADVTLMPDSGRGHVASMPLSLAVREALDAMRESCAATDRYFTTPYLLLALLDLPNSSVAWCFDQISSRLSDHWRRLLTTYQKQRVQDGASGNYREFNWNDRDDVSLAKQLASIDGAPAVNELYLFLGILGNLHSGTRLELIERLGPDDYGRLRQLAENLRESNIGWSE
jgi:hypothetical protein